MTVPPTWEDRDFPVLEAIVSHLEDSGDDSFSAGDLTRYLPAFFEDSDIQKSLNALAGHQPAVLAARLQRQANGHIYHVQGGVTGYARQLVGLWPKPGEFKDRLLARLDAAEAAAADEDAKRLIRRFRNTAADLSGDLLRQALSGFMRSL